MKPERILPFTILFLFVAAWWVSEQSISAWVADNLARINRSEAVVTYYGENGEAIRVPLNGMTVVLDAGHGGNDPGKVGVVGTKEKEINLSIAYKLRDVLSAKGYVVVMTRKGDGGLYAEADSNRKAADMKKRVEIMNTTQASYVISIHQNSFPGEEVRGAQVFYHTKSEEGKWLAESIQASLVRMDPENRRMAKANNDYYVLRNTEAPTVLVECGFLSCPQEEQLLLTEEYQWKLANAIADGLLCAQPKK